MVVLFHLDDLELPHIVLCLPKSQSERLI
jgi:hypothetical protein